MESSVISVSDVIKTGHSSDKTGDQGRIRCGNSGANLRASKAAGG